MVTLLATHSVVSSQSFLVLKLHIFHCVSCKHTDILYGFLDIYLASCSSWSPDVVSRAVIFSLKFLVHSLPWRSPWWKDSVVHIGKSDLWTMYSYSHSLMSLSLLSNTKRRTKDVNWNYNSRRKNTSPTSRMSPAGSNRNAHDSSIVQGPFSTFLLV